MKLILYSDVLIALHLQYILFQLSKKNFENGSLKKIMRFKLDFITFLIILSFTEFAYLLLFGAASPIAFMTVNDILRNTLSRSQSSSGSSCLHKETSKTFMSLITNEMLSNLIFWISFLRTRTRPFLILLEI
jgi:hypothetical protein